MMGLVSHGCELVFTVGGRGAIKLGVEGALIGEVYWLEVNSNFLILYIFGT